MKDSERNGNVNSKFSFGFNSFNGQVFTGSILTWARTTTPFKPGVTSRRRRLASLPIPNAPTRNPGTEDPGSTCGSQQISKEAPW